MNNSCVTYWPKYVEKNNRVLKSLRSSLLNLRQDSGFMLIGLIFLNRKRICTSCLSHTSHRTCRPYVIRPFVVMYPFFRSILGPESLSLMWLRHESHQRDRRQTARRQTARRQTARRQTARRQTKPKMAKNQSVYRIDVRSVLPYEVLSYAI